MALPRVVKTAPPQGGGYADELAGGGFVPFTWPEFSAQPSAAQWDAARAAQARDPSGLPWLPYAPLLDLTPGIDTLGEPVSPGIAFPLWLSKFSATPGAASFFQVKGEDAADAAIKRAGGNAAAEYMTARVQDPKGNADHDFLRVLYVHEGPFWRPLAAYHFYEASSWVTFRNADLIPIASLALAVWGGALAQSIGRAVVGAQLAAAYPALPGLVGNVALQTAASGGDIGAAVQNAALGLVGAQAGAAVGGGALGAATSAATVAALRGGDIQSAVASSLLQYGAKNVDFDSFTTGASAWGNDNFAPDVAAFDPVSSGLTWVDASGAGISLDTPFGTNLPPDTALLSDPGVFGPPEPKSWEMVDWGSVTPGQDQTTDRATWAIDAPQYGGTDYGGGTPKDPVSAVPASSSGDIFASITSAALALIKVNAAYQASQSPQPRTAVQSGSYVKTPNPNGTLTVRNTQTGATQTTKPEVGAPYVLPNGSTIINNGNGTFTTIRPDGQTTTAAYASTASAGASGIPPVVLYGGLGLAAFLLLRPR